MKESTISNYPKKEILTIIILFPILFVTLLVITLLLTSEFEQNYYAILSPVLFIVVLSNIMQTSNILENNNNNIVIISLFFIMWLLMILLNILVLVKISKYKNKYKVLGQTSAILFFIPFVPFLIPYILYFLYYYQVNKKIINNPLNKKPKIKNSDNIFKTRKYTKILLIIQPFVFVFYLLSIILGFESLDLLITFILLSVAITIVNIVFSVLLIYSSSEENHIYKNEAKICGILSLLTVSGVIAFFMCISYLIKTSRLINNQNKNI